MKRPVLALLTALLSLSSCVDRSANEERSTSTPVAAEAPASAPLPDPPAEPVATPPTKQAQTPEAPEAAEPAKVSAAKPAPPVTKPARAPVAASTPPAKDSLPPVAPPAKTEVTAPALPDPPARAAPSTPVTSPVAEKTEAPSPPSAPAEPSKAAAPPAAPSTPVDPPATPAPTPKPATPAAPPAKVVPTPTRPTPPASPEVGRVSPQTTAAPQASATPPVPIKPSAPTQARPVDPPSSAVAPPATPSPAPAPPAPAVQLRGLWVDAFGPGFKTPEQVTRLVADAQKLGVNALFVQAGKRGDCYCERASMPRTDDPEVPAGFDPLQDVIDKAHAVGIQVHAWITTTSVVNVPENPAPSQPDHVFNTNGLTAEGDANWLMSRADGETRAGNDYFLDPGHPDAAAYIREMYVSVARAYDVDGVQLDRVRYPDPTGGVQDWGYNPVAVARFQQETGTAEVPTPTDPRWTAWRRARIDDLVRTIHDDVKAVRPSAWVSAAVVTYGPGPRSSAEFKASRAYTEVLQDWPSWLASGSTDLIVTMNYKREAGAQAAWFDGWNRFAASVKGAGKVAAGTALYLNDERANVAQARRALSSNVDGWVGYSYRTPDAAVEAGRRSADSVWSSLGTKLTSGPLNGRPAWGTP